MTSSKEETRAALCPTSLMGRVAVEIAARSLVLPVAARQIGVSVGTLKKHLAGEHVRSDSALKYQDWLQGRATSFKFTSSRSSGVEEVFGETDRLSLLPEPSEPRLVVDIFSGCGGLAWFRPFTGRQTIRDNSCSRSRS